MNKMSEELAIHDKDTGSSEFQIAELTSKIENLSIVIPTFNESQNIKKLTEDIIMNVNITNYEILFILSLGLQ